MGSLISLLIASAAAVAVPADNAPAPAAARGGVQVIAMARAEVLRAEHSLGEAGQTGLQRKKRSRGDGSVQIEFY